MLLKRLPALLLFGLCACGGGESVDDRRVPGLASERAIGIVAADDPYAATVGRDVLEAGGSAADAAAAMGFTLAVTHPAAASLGGGGLCLYYDSKSRTARSIDFLPRTPKRGGAVALPGLVRGFGRIHAQWGEKSWAFVLAPAERLATDGHAMSRALARRSKAAHHVWSADRSARALLTGLDGTPLGEGAHLEQTGLGVTLSLLQSKGADDFYTGTAARIWLDDASQSGAKFTADELATYPVHVRPAVRRTFRDRTAFLPAIETGAGALLDDLWSELERIGTLARRVARTSGPDVSSVANAVAESYGVPASLPADMGSTGFVVTTRKGDAAACGLTLNGAFGSGRQSGQTGVFAAHAHRMDARGLAGAFLSPVIVTMERGRAPVFTGIGTGGAQAPATVTHAALASDLPPAMVLAEAGGASDTTLVNAVSCPNGGNKCLFAADPRGYGLALEAFDGD